MFKLVHYVYPTSFGYVGYTIIGNRKVYYRLNTLQQIEEVISEKTWSVYFQQRTSIVRRINKFCVVKPITGHLKSIYRKIDNDTSKKVKLPIFV